MLTAYPVLKCNTEFVLQIGGEFSICMKYEECVK
jgi:hypothetical protein